MADQFTFTVEEVLAICLTLRAPPLLGTGGSSLEGLADQARDLVLATAVRSLVARGVLPSDQLVEAHPALQAVAVAAQPGLRATVARESGGELSIGDFAAIPERAVVHTWSPEDIHHLEWFSTEDLPDRLLKFALLGGQQPAQSEPVRTTAGALEEAMRSIDENELAMAERILGGDQAASGVTQLVAALAERVSTTQVLIVHADPDDGLQSTDLMWIDGGQQGLWERRPPPELPDPALSADDALAAARSAAVELLPVSAEELTSRVHAAMPRAKTTGSRPT